MNTVPATLGLGSEEVTGLLATAGRAPSLHNSQPWRFRVLPDLIELWADPQRRLPAADPSGREQRLACGAALFNLRLALHGHGIRPLVTTPNDPDHPDLLACIRYGGRKPPTPAQQQLLAAVPRRHTNRRPFTDEPITSTELSAMRRAALDEGAWLYVVNHPAQRATLSRLAAHAHATQQANPAFLAEAAHWIAVEPGRPDGIPALQNEHRPSAHERWVRRDFTSGHGPTTTATGSSFEHEPAILALAAHMFGTSAELAAGQAMQRVLLTATGDGLSASSCHR